MISESGKLVTNPRTTCSIDCSSFKAGMMILTSLGIILHPIRGKVHFLGGGGYKNLHIVIVCCSEYADKINNLYVKFCKLSSATDCIIEHPYWDYGDFSVYAGNRHTVHGKIYSAQRSIIGEKDL